MRRRKPSFNFEANTHATVLSREIVGLDCKTMIRIIVFVVFRTTLKRVIATDSEGAPRLSGSGEISDPASAMQC
jgi:hypothetical protein